MTTLLTTLGLCLVLLVGLPVFMGVALARTFKGRMKNNE